jgi:hypothetical protein
VCILLFCEYRRLLFCSMYTLSTICSEISSAALASCVAAFGGLMPNNVRSTIDSILHSCLSTLYCSGGSSIFAYAEAKRSILQLATNCVTVPWGDGGRSTTNEIVRKVSQLLKNDADVTVASMALSTLCVVDAFMTPRAPAILIASRSQDGNNLTATEMLRSINEKEMEIKSSPGTKGAKEKKSTKKDKKASAKPAAAKSKKTATEDISEVKTKKIKVTEATNTVKKESESSNGVGAIKNVTVESDVKKILSEPTKTVVKDVANDVMDVDESTEVADKAEEITQQGRQKNKEDTEVGDDDDFSLDDFPEIVDEEPDEGDRM